MGLAEHEGVFCYVNSVFAPGLDEGVGNLWRVSFDFLLLVWEFDRADFVGEVFQDGGGVGC